MSSNERTTHQTGDLHLVIETNDAASQLNDLASELLERREAILDAWRAAGDAGPGGSVASSLSRAQFNDHIPAVLDCLASTLRAWPNEQDSEAVKLQAERVCEHGLQRWQQGYPLRELIAEWGYLQVCVVDELERYAAEHPSLDPTVMPTARRAWSQLCASGVTQSATQYWRLQQAESAGHVNDLEKALSALQAIEQSRAEAWRTAAHDLRGSVTVVKGAATLLHDSDPTQPELRGEVADMLSKSVSSLHEMLNDLLSLARLEAGHEQRELTTFDAAALLRDFCLASESTATQRGLYLKMDGPQSMPVQGDRTKVLRIVQNLLLNAVKYTQRGGVTVTWGLDLGRDTDRWTFSVQDTGPGIDENRAAPLAQELHSATEAADEAREASTDRRRDMPAAATLPSASEALPQSQQPGEGVGLSIVKRLCELLDAGLELATKPGQGTTIRVILPRSY
ncbi:MAG TPA: HAMP domain-containing sensor histidine kinase [Thermoanaerobaculia bacterium]|jgi:signal transduction histidine kinase|nr:HAMP domain-containing sensor histidine kinase [Thermoanaerobaculia bacterium]